MGPRPARARKRPGLHEKRPLARPSLLRARRPDYQAATTAPLNLVSMNCFTAGLW